MRVINWGLEESRGTPQGGVLSYLLWLLMINEIHVSFDRLRIKAIAYDDDVAILIKWSISSNYFWPNAKCTSTAGWLGVGNGLGTKLAKTEHFLKKVNFRYQDRVELLSSRTKYLGPAFKLEQEHRGTYKKWPHYPQQERYREELGAKHTSTTMDIRLR